MRPDSKEMARLWDIMDAARTVVQFTQGMRFEEFLQDRRTRNAVERNLEIIGEAAHRLSAATRELLSDIPWRSMIGLRNVLAHEYGDIRYEVVWSVIREKLAPLIKQLDNFGVDCPPPLDPG